MQLALSTTIPPPPVPVRGELSENSCQGFETKNPALHPGHNIPNSTAALGVSWSVASETRSSHVTGRFMSRDPEDHKLRGPDGTPIDPKELHKYLYAGGDPLNRIDPSGRADTIETIFTISVVSSPLEIGAEDVGLALTEAFCFTAKTIARAQIPPGMLGFGPPGWPGPVAAVCTAFGF